MYIHDSTTVVLVQIHQSQPRISESSGSGRSVFLFNIRVPALSVAGPYEQ
jgi:hypothetical protein